MLGRCAQGDNPSWTTFFGIYGPLIHRYARWGGLAEHDADEVVANVMRNLLQALRGGFEVDHSVGRFRHYLRKIANREIAAQRRRGTRQPVGLEQTPEPPADDEPSEEHWAALERQERLRICLERLRAVPSSRPRDLRAFERYALAGEPAERVALELGISKSRLYAIKHEMIVELRRLRIQLDAILGEV
jgi:RNA polymerase sigma-70 factor (ECF subfamily)